MSLCLIDICRTDNILTRYLLRDDKDQLFWGILPWLPREIENSNATDLRKFLLEADAFFPTYACNMTKYQDSTTAPDIFIKTQRMLLDPSFPANAAHFKRLVQREVAVAEVLAKAPHPRICEYRGAVLDGSNRIIGIAYTRYLTDLYTHVVGHGKSADAGRVLLQVGSAVEHLHGLGLVHCDVRPANIFVVKGEGEEIDVVLGDFDAATKVGCPVEQKHATPGWWPGNVGFGDDATVEVDRFGMTKLEEWLRLHAMGKPETGGKAE